MKRLTISHISAASIRANRKTYRSLGVGILLAVFLATAVTVCAYGVVKANEQEIVRQVGYTDCVLYDTPDVTDETLRDSGLFESIGKVYLTACVKDSDVYLGTMDEAGTDILCRTCREGRMPEGPGEIAIEQSALEKLRLEAGVGDTVTWTLEPIDGAAEERTFTIVGILREQAGQYDMSGSFLSPGQTFHWFSVLLSDDEPGFAAGRTVVHRVMTYAPLVSYSRVTRYHSLEGCRVFSVSRAYGTVGMYSTTSDAHAYLEMTILLLILGVSLLLATCIGISSAMESVLAVKTEEIGMLRAVGATKRQIRRIFGRDAWLLSLCTLPVGLLLGVAAAWLFGRIMPERMVFSMSVWLLLPVIAIAAFCVFVSSAIPLQRASRQLPMGVLRDTAMLRKARRFQSKTSFHASRLIAGRQLLVHPWRQLGAALMVMATLLCTAFLGELVYQVVEDRLAGRTSAAFVLYAENPVMDYYDFSVTKPKTTLSAQDMAQIRAMPEVEHADAVLQTHVNLVFDEEAPDYYRVLTGQSYTAFDGTESMTYTTWTDDGVEDYLDFGPEDPRPTGEDGESILRAREYSRYEQMTAAADAQGLDGKLLSLPVYVCTLDGAELTVAEGQVDLAALDAGTQVLVYAPTVYLVNEGDVIVTSVDKPTETPILREIQNDAFYAGQSLTLVQLLNGEAVQEAQTYEAWRAAYAAMERNDAAVTVGAVLEGKAVPYTHIGILTTEKGAEALGIDMTQPSIVRIYLREDIDEETETSLVSRLERIAMRGDLALWNLLKDMRESTQEQNQILLLFGGMVVLFFAVAVAMQVGNSGRRIRADQRMIGTLRAVGADESSLLGCYRLPMVLTAAIGSLLAAALYLALAFAMRAYLVSSPVVIVPAMLLLGALCVMCCFAGLRVRLKSVLGSSIVENIREL